MNGLPLTLALHSGVPLRRNACEFDFPYLGRLVPDFNDPDTVVAAFFRPFLYGVSGHVHKRVQALFQLAVFAFGCTDVTASM